MASIALGTFNAFNASYGSYTMQFNYTAATRSGTTITITGCGISGTRNGTGYTTNRIATCGTVGGTGSGGTWYNVTLNNSGTQSPASLSYTYGTVTLTGIAAGTSSVAARIECMGTGASTGWGNQTGTKGDWTISIPVPTATAPSVATSSGSITPTSAIIYGSVSSWGSNASSSSSSLQWGTSTSYGNAISNGTTISNLTPSTTYYHRMQATNTAGLTGTATGSFTTSAAVPASSTIAMTARTTTTLDVKITATAGTGAISSYAVSRDNGATWTNIGTNTTYQFTGLTANTTYQVKARVYDQYTSGDSAAVAMTTLAVPTINSVTHTRTNNSITTTVSATPASGSSIAGYSFSIDGTTWTTMSMTNNHTFTGLTEGTTYTIYVRVYDVSLQYASQSATVKTVAPPTITTLTALDKKATSLYIQATATNESGSPLSYRFSSDDGDNYSDWQATATYTFINLIPLTNYDVRVQVKNIYEQEGEKAQVFQTLASPPVINRVYADLVTPNLIRMNCTATSIYDLQYSFSKDNGTTWLPYQDENRYTFDGLIAATEYSFRVRVIDTFGQTAVSQTVKITTAEPFKPRALQDGYDYIAPITVAKVVYMSDGETNVEEALEAIGKGGHDIVNQDGVTMPKQDKLQFLDTELRDDTNNERTVVDLTSKINSYGKTLRNIEYITYDEYMTLLANDEDDPETEYHIETDEFGTPGDVIELQERVAALELRVLELENNAITFVKTGEF